MNRVCKKCLLLEAGERKSYETVKGYLENLDENQKVSESDYKKRLVYCRACENLISGMCRKCGCYVEIRAALKNKQCADYDNRKW